RHSRTGTEALTQAEALRRQLPPSSSGARSPTRACPGLAGRRRGGRERRPGLADRGLARARGVGHDGRPGRGAPEPEADPDAGRRGGRPAAQGLPDRRRARAVLGGGIAWRSRAAREAEDTEETEETESGTG